MRATPRLLAAALGAIFLAAAVVPPVDAQDESTTSSTSSTEAPAAVPAAAAVDSADAADAVDPSTTAVPLPPGDPSRTAARGTTAQVTETSPPPPPPPAPAGAELPGDSGSGRRVVYSKGQMRVWLIEADGSLTRTYRVSGRMDQPRYGTYQVFSRSPYTCAMKRPDICMRFMVRFTKAFSGDNIGFHEIPVRAGRYPLQSDAQLGQPLSGGCVRQSTADAIFMWEWAPVGTTVVVIP